jgi:Fe-S-cluster containining protein
MAGESSRIETRTQCIRCGDCCLRSSATLQKEDLRLVHGGRVERNNLMTLRKGELVTDPVRGTVGPGVHEGIKIKEKEGPDRGCVFYEGKEKACTIYDERPLQCAALKCWDTTEILEVLSRPKLERLDVVRDGILRALIQKHEKRCSYAAVEDLVGRIVTEGEKAVNGIIDLMKFDYYLRLLVPDKLSISGGEMDFYFGRPLTATIRAYGLKVTREPDGSFFLTRIEDGEPE